jgi:hypothetical protein
MVVDLPSVTAKKAMLPLLLFLAGIGFPQISFAAEVGAIPDRIAAKYDISSPWYAKYVDAKGIPILGSTAVSDAALLTARSNVLRLLATSPKSVRAKLASQKVRVVVWGRGEVPSSIPEFRAKFGTGLDAIYWGGFGATTSLPICAGTEANLVDNDGSENLMVHEFGHTIAEMALATIDANFMAELNAAWNARSKVTPARWAGTFAGTDTKEYWAEGLQSYFNVNRPRDAVHNGVDTRAELQAYDPLLYALLNRIYGSKPLDAVDRRKNKAAQPATKGL